MKTKKKEAEIFEMKDKEFSILCSSVCRGDEIMFQKEKVLKGRFSNVHLGYDIIYARVLRESYGKLKQQHTFTLQCLETGRIFRLKGRTIYRFEVYRREWKDEKKREEILEEKHRRGREARRQRRYRTRNYYYYYDREHDILCSCLDCQNDAFYEEYSDDDFESDYSDYSDYPYY